MRNLEKICFMKKKFLCYQRNTVEMNVPNQLRRGIECKLHRSVPQSLIEIVEEEQGSNDHRI